MPKNIVVTEVHSSPPGLSDADVTAFAGSLTRCGYSEVTIQAKRQIAASFALWTRQKQIAVVDLREAHGAKYLKATPRRSKAARRAVKRAALRLLFNYLRIEGRIPARAPSSPPLPGAVLQDRFETYLRQERGLSERSVQAYRPFIHNFLVDRVANLGSPCVAALVAENVRDFLLKCVRKRPTKSSRLLGTAIRSFLRFLFQRGETVVDLSLAVPTIRQWRQASVHAFLLPEEVEQVLRACDQTTPVGRRDHAVLLLLARLGLRAGEVLGLELGDIQWRTGEILVRGKGRVLERLPLLADIGESLALYVQKDRSHSTSRRVFLRTRAPRVGLTTQTAVGAIARRALARAGLRPSLCGAHLFRYSLATTMIRRGASMSEIGEILRHRSPDTTAIYAKVDFETLRAVTLPWPVIGGGR